MEMNTWLKRRIKQFSNLFTLCISDILVCFGNTSATDSSQAVHKKEYYTVWM